MARQFTANTDEIDIGTASELQITGDITVAVWAINGGETIEEHIVGAYLASGGFDGWGVSVAGSGGGDVFKYWSNGIGSWQNANTTMSTTAWQHVGVTTSGTGASAGTFYYNGASDGTFTHTAPGTHTGTKMIGTRSDSSATHTYRGHLAELAVWDVALTAGEMNMLAHGVCPLRVRNASLVGYWPLQGSSAVDLSGSGNNGTISGTVISDHAPVGPMLTAPGGWPGAFTAAAAATTRRYSLPVLGVG